MKLRFTPRAAKDIAEVADYIRKRNPAASLHVRAAIYESLQGLALFPYIGRIKQDRRKPEGAARVLLTVIEKEPEAVTRALAAAAVT